MKIQNRQQLLVVLTIAAAGLAIVVNFIIPPAVDWWSSRQNEITQLQKQIADGNRLLKREAADRSHWKEMQTNALAANPSEAEQQFLSALDGWAGASGVQITSRMPQWKSDNTNYMTLNCRVETAGDLGALSQFIYNIEKGPLAVRLDSVELSSHDNTGQQMTLGLEINGLALTQTDKK